MQETSLEFKGLKRGLYAVYKGSGNFETFLKALEAKLDNSGGFFAGAVLAGIYGIELDDIEEEILVRTLGERYDMKMKRPITGGIARNRPGDNSGSGRDTRFVYSTLRSGQRVSSKGNVIVLGDVNAGAEVEAGGNIVVMGSLRGSAWAGAPDNYETLISAVVLKPTQLRIGGIAVRWPDGERPVEEPEMAYVEKGKVYVRSIYGIKQMGQQTT